MDLARLGSVARNDAIGVRIRPRAFGAFLSVVWPYAVLFQTYTTKYGGLWSVAVFMPRAP